MNAELRYAIHERETIAFEKRLEELENDPQDLGEQIREQALTKDELKLIGMAVQAFVGTDDLIRKLAAGDL